MTVFLSSAVEGPILLKNFFRDFDQNQKGEYFLFAIKHFPRDPKMSQIFDLQNQGHFWGFFGLRAPGLIDSSNLMLRAERGLFFTLSYVGSDPAEAPPTAALRVLRTRC